MKAMWAEIVYDVIWVLGPPPCKYAIMTLGEMAVDELTPYSDAKFAILLERNEKPNIVYFDKFATYLKLKVCVKSMHNSWHSQIVPCYFT